jgi:rhamnosyltransferase
MRSPQISVVILTKNAGRAFEQTLDKIFAQRVEGGFEIVIVDSGSTDGTIERVQKHALRLYCIPPDEFNFGRTRNYGFSMARGEFIATLSQDVIPCDEQWLKKLTAPFGEDERVAAVQGFTKLPEHGNVFYWERVGRFYFTSEVQRWLSLWHDSLSFVNCAIRRSFWQHHNLNAAPFSEDKAFQRSINNAGFKIASEPSAVCFHGHQYSFRSLVVRLIGEGKGWRNVDISYSVTDCLRDILANRWMLKDGLRRYFGERIGTINEALFPILRPVCVYLGNQKMLSI